MKALRSVLVLRKTTWWRSRSAWEMATDPKKRIWVLQQWDTPMSKWAGGGKDWIMAQGPLRKEDVTCSLLASMRQATANTEKKESTCRRRGQETWPRLLLEVPAEDKKLMLEIRRDSKTIVDWVDNRHVKLTRKESTIASVQNILRNRWERGVDLRHRVDDWASHIFREHNEEADSWAGLRDALFGSDLDHLKSFRRDLRHGEVVDLRYLDHLKDFRRDLRLLSPVERRTKDVRRGFFSSLSSLISSHISHLSHLSPLSPLSPLSLSLSLSCFSLSFYDFYDLTRDSPNVKRNGRASPTKAHQPLDRRAGAAWS